MRPPPARPLRAETAGPLDELATWHPVVRGFVARTSAPVRVALCGRAGVGRRTLAAVLSRTGIAVTEPVDRTEPDLTADVVCWVVVEAIKPEDLQAVAAARACGTPVVVAWNKADIADCPGGVATLSRRIGAAVEPISGLLALTVLHRRIDDPTWMALKRFAVGDSPGHLIDILGFDTVHHAAERVRSGCSPGELDAALWSRSRVGALFGRLSTVTAQVHYRRLCDIRRELEALAVGDPRIRTVLDDPRLHAVRTAAAIEMARAAGLMTRPGAGGPTNERPRTRLHTGLPAARHWQHISRAPVSALYRACAADIARAMLRDCAYATAAGSHGE